MKLVSGSRRTTTKTHPLVPKTFDLRFLTHLYNSNYAYQLKLWISITINLYLGGLTMAKSKPAPSHTSHVNTNTDVFAIGHNLLAMACSASRIGCKFTEGAEAITDVGINAGVNVVQTMDLKTRQSLADAHKANKAI